MRDDMNELVEGIFEYGGTWVDVVKALTVRFPNAAVTDITNVLLEGFDPEQADQSFQAGEWFGENLGEWIALAGSRGTYIAFRLLYSGIEKVCLEHGMAFCPTCERTGGSFLVSVPDEKRRFTHTSFLTLKGDVEWLFEINGGRAVVLVTRTARSEFTVYDNHTALVKKTFNRATDLAKWLNKVCAVRVKDNAMA